MTIRQFFSDLNEDIGMAKTKKALSVIRKRGEGFMDSINDPMINPKIKRQAKKKWARARVKIIKKSRKLT